MLEVLRDEQRLEAAKTINVEIRISLKSLDTSTLGTKEEIAKRFDDLIRMLMEQKAKALGKADDFAEKTRKQLMDLALEVNGKKIKLIHARAKGKQMLHVKDKKETGKARLKFREFMERMFMETVRSKC